MLICLALGGAAARPARRRGGGRLGVPAAGSARDPGPAAAGHRHRAQPRRPVRAAGAQPAAAGWPAQGGAQRRLLDRRARRLRRDALHRPVHGRGARARRWCFRPRRRWRSSPGSASAWRLPFLLLGFVPALRRRLPRPGAWMDRFRRILSVPMFLTALGLAWVLGRQAGVDGMALGLAAALLLALGLVVGRRAPGRAARLAAARAGRCSPRSAACLLVPPTAPAGGAARQARAQVRAVQRGAACRAARRAAAGLRLFHRRLVRHLQGQRERRARARRGRRAPSPTRNVAVLVGDWTRGDAAIGRFLEQHGRSGVPLYLYYAPGRPAEDPAAGADALAARVRWSS